MKPNVPPRNLGLYIHIPFCASKCAYCDFYSLAGAEARMDAYVDALCAHLSETAPRAELHQVDSVYFGGGTPSLLGQKRLKTLLNLIGKKYKLTRDAEITLEANPDSAGDWKELRALRRAGFNRLSLGMQSANDDELREIGRIHTFSQVEAAVEAARKAGFQNLSLDLIYGLPGQSAESWNHSLNAAVSLTPQHLSCYGLKLEEGTPLYQRRGDPSLPDDDAQAELYLTTVDTLRHFGFFQYEISNFARPGFASRHNLKYWQLQEYAGFGPGAHSDFGGVRYAYARDLEGYIRGVTEGAPLLSESERIPERDRDTEYLMLGLRTTHGIEAGEFAARYRRRFDCFVPFLEECRRVGYARQSEEGRWSLTPRGFLVSNAIIRQMLDLLAEDKRRQAEARDRGDYHIRNL